MLPRLLTLIQHERRTIEGLTLLLDLGDTCALESWVCRATQGRAPFLVLDSMGYDLALVGASEQVPIPPEALRLLVGQITMSLVLWNRPGHITKRGITFSLASGEAEPPAETAGIRVDRSTDHLPEVGTRRPVLGDVAHGCLARVDMKWPEWTVQAARLILMPENTLADPTTAAVVELVENEARHEAHY